VRAAAAAAAAKPPASAAAAPAPSAGSGAVRAREDDTFVHVRGVRYTKLECVGQGGTCKVFKVITQQRRILAVKRIRLAGAQAREENVANFLEEIKLLERLRGRGNIIQLIDAEVIRDEGLIYLVLEFGETDLAQLLARRTAARTQRAAAAAAAAGAAGSPPVEDSLCQRVADSQNFLRLYFQQMVEAVASIHEQRIVHSDLKPANFLIVEGSLKLIDFGIARAIESKAHDTTNIVREHQVGTINYMSPEAVLNGQASASGRSLKIGRASDIWSLGCILYQMVYGATPFSGITQLLPKLNAIANSTLPIAFPHTGLAPLEDLMRRALDRDPATRITIPQILVHPFIQPPAPAAGPREDVLAAALAQCGRMAALGPAEALALAGALLAGETVEQWLARRPPAAERR
jgi:serine/threonine-protein kinase TTK/MPS1